MSALYLHIPFCKRICAYCDFHRFADLSAMTRVVEAMHCEMEETAGFLNDRQLRTIYFGGGTPSLLPAGQLQRFIDRTHSLYDTRQLAEITVEVNPDDVTDDFVNALTDTEINRISVGIQSFDDRLLRLMNRRHDSLCAQRAVERLQKAGYRNITVDLIFGFDGFGDEVTAEDLRRTAALGIQHVSAYHLTIEPLTRLGRMASRGEFFAISDERSERLFRMIHHRLTDEGFEHYEVSNFAREGFRSQHNSSYWTGAEYLGIGTGAHSFDGRHRRWCTQSAEEYAAERRYQSETLTERDRLNEMIMTSLRRVEGIDLDLVRQRFGQDAARRLAAEAAALEGFGAEVDSRSIRIPPERMLVSDAVIERLFEV